MTGITVRRELRIRYGWRRCHRTVDSRHTNSDFRVLDSCIPFLSFIDLSELNPFNSFVEIIPRAIHYPEWGPIIDQPPMFLGEESESQKCVDLPGMTIVSTNRLNSFEQVTIAKEGTKLARAAAVSDGAKYK
jgi:hypothetical protein